MEKLWGKIKKSVMEGVTTAAEKTEEYTKLGKAKIDILSVKRKISKGFAELGGIVYDAVKEKKGPAVLKTEEVTAIIEKLNALEDDLAAKESELDTAAKTDDSEAKDEKGECSEEAE